MENCLLIRYLHPAASFAPPCRRIGMLIFLIPYLHQVGRLSPFLPFPQLAR